ncbi:MAG TPA: NAD(P)-dependent oxidoreductase [Polyangiales bacterium]|nr:NAD(P)-dependent oxidoreductase [Polyangiales bacterium]
MAETLAFLGLGVMGGNMARRLVEAEHEVWVWNRTLSKVEAFVAAHGGKSARTPAEVANAANIVCICVGNDEHVRAVLEGPDGVFAGLRPGSLLIDHSTVSADLARAEAREAARLGCMALDAPVSGGQAGAEQGTLTVMAGGQDVAFHRAQPIFEAYSQRARLLGPAGSGQLAKMVNQICIAGVLAGLAEGLHFAETAGLDPVEVVEAIAHGAAQSWQMVNRHASMVERKFEFGFAVDWMRKDLGLAIEEARRNGSRLPVTALVDQFYSDVQALGGSRWDTSSLIARFDTDWPGQKKP